MLFRSGRSFQSFRKGEVLFAQGDVADTVYYIRRGRVKVMVLSEQGKEAVVGILEAGQFAGEDCLSGRAVHGATLIAMQACEITAIRKQTMLETLRREPDFAELFMHYLLDRNRRVSEDLLDQLFNCSEKRLARLLETGLSLRDIDTKLSRLAPDGAAAVARSAERIVADGGNVRKYVDLAKKKDSGFRLMGFGHRVYKNYDPRARLMRTTCHEVLNELGLHDDRLFKLAIALEKIALEDDYFVQRKLYPNVDFYSGIVQRAIGIPVNLFTGIFALARTVGWIAQLNEMIGDPEYKIGRPRQLFTGSPRRDVPAKR